MRICCVKPGPIRTYNYVWQKHLSNTNISLLNNSGIEYKIFVLMSKTLKVELFFLCVNQYFLKWAGDGFLVGVESLFFWTK